MEKFRNLISLYPGSILDLISKKKENYRIRLKGQNEHLAQEFNLQLDGILRVNEVLKLDEILKDILLQIQNNPDVEITEIESVIYKSIIDEFKYIYGIIENFNEGSPDVNQIFISREWTQLGEIVNNNFQIDQATGISIRLKSLQDKIIALYSIIKSLIVTFQSHSDLDISKLEGFNSAMETINNINQNTELINSALESAKSIQTFNISNIDQALKNVGVMFYYKDMYSVFQKDVSIWRKIVEALFLIIDDIRKSPIWWFMFGLISLISVFIILFIDFLTITNDLIKYKDIWQIILSMHLIGASFLGYFTVFCFSNYKKIEQRHESYRFRGILTKSFGYLIETADEEQKKILYPKALDAIFKDLPDTSSGQQDVNINLPVTEILKSFSKS